MLSTSDSSDFAETSSDWKMFTFKQPAGWRLAICARALITLDVYGHLIPTMQEELADMIDNLVMPTAVQIDQKAKHNP